MGATDRHLPVLVDAPPAGGHSRGVCQRRPYRYRKHGPGTGHSVTRLLLLDFGSLLAALRAVALAAHVTLFLLFISFLISFFPTSSASAYVPPSEKYSTSGAA